MAADEPTGMLASRRRLGVAAAAAVAPMLLSGLSAPANAVSPPFCGVSEVTPMWAFSTPWQEDLVAFQGYQLWTRDVNNTALDGALAALRRRPKAAEGKLPVLVVAGGPGLPHDYLESLELLAAFRRVVFFDSVGCGSSYLASGRRGPRAEDITPELLLDELDALTAALQLRSGYHIYAHGTGAMLALQYAATRAPTGLRSLTLASTPDTYSALISDRRSAAMALGEAAAVALLNREGDPEAQADFQAALQQYQAERLCRRLAGGAAAPACVSAAFLGRSRAAVQALAGGRLFSAAGRLADWDGVALAPALGPLPVLVSRGSDDEVSEASAERLAAALGGGKLLSMLQSGAYQHIDAWEPHLTAVEEHMSTAEGSKIVTA